MPWRARWGSPWTPPSASRPPCSTSSRRSGARAYTGAPRGALLERVGARVGLSGPPLDAALAQCLEDAEVIESGGLLFRPAVLWREWDVAEWLTDLARVHFTLGETQRAAVEAVIARNRLTTEQAAAVRNALEHGVSVLTGRPGTGKTHTQGAVVEACRALGLEVRIAAPTGKAAVRARQVTKLNATTVHKLLGGPVGGARKDGPVRGGVLVIDEASMCDLDVMAWLAKNVNRASDVRVVLAGDHAQLPSVGPGQVLADVIAAGVLPTTRLTEIQRQKAGSRITANAHALLDRRPLDLRAAHDFSFVDLGDPGERPTPAYYAAAQAAVVDAVRALVAQESGSLVRRAGLDKPFHATRDLQVLTPRTSGPLGVSALNALLRPLLNPGAVDGARISEVHAAVGDRVICTENDYQVPPDGIMNGEQGVITATDADAETVTVQMDDGRVVTLVGHQTYLLSHAFATTVHRAQGSEYPCVVAVFHSAHAVGTPGEPRRLDVRLVYTAITRAQQQVVLVADQGALALARSGGAAARHTGLAAHLRALHGGHA